MQQAVVCVLPALNDSKVLFPDLFLTTDSAQYKYVVNFSKHQWQVEKNFSLSP